MSILIKGFQLKIFNIGSLRLCQLMNQQPIYFEFSCANCSMNQKPLRQLSSLLKKILYLASMMRLGPIFLPRPRPKSVSKDQLPLPLKMKMVCTLLNQKLHQIVPPAMPQSESSSPLLHSCSSSSF